jgi:hypothetical protein
LFCSIQASPTFSLPHHLTQSPQSIINSLDSFICCHIFLVKCWPWMNPSIHLGLATHIALC